MYDTARRVALVKQRVRENTRRRQRREAISLSAACMLLFAVLTQAAGTVVGPGQTAAWGVFGAMLLREDAGGLRAGGRRLLCRGGGHHRAVLSAQKQGKPEKRRSGQARPTRTGGEKPMKKRILSILLLCCMVLTLLPTAAFAAGEIDEQFTLAPGGTYYFDLSAMGIPGTVNDALPDKTMRYVPFTYAGTVDSYKLTSEMATTEEYAQQSKYAHSLFIADFAVTHEVSWDNLNAKGLIFGKNYTAGGVDYTLRAPSVGSSYTGSGDSERGTPKSNEWDKILDKDDGYIKNWREMLSCGQDTTIRISASSRAVRGWNRSARFWTSYNTSSSSSYPTFGFRPVLEVPNSDTLDSGGLKAVTLDLGGGKLGGSSDAIHIIVKNGSAFTAPASDGLTRPDGNTGSYFMWLGSDGKLYAPGDSVPADVTELTVQWTAPTYTVTLHANGGSVSPASVTTGADGKLASLPTPTRSSYSFNGWYTEKNGGTKVTTDTVFSANTTVCAHWTYTGGYYSPVYYTLTFETNGGDKLSPVSGSYNALIDLSKYAPKRSGYAFTGWYSERSLTNKVSGVYLTKDMTVYAGWRVTTAPQTGDSSVLGLWGISLCTSLAGCLALTTWQIRRRREEKSLQSIEK